MKNEIIIEELDKISASKLEKEFNSKNNFSIEEVVEFLTTTDANGNSIKTRKINLEDVQTLLDEISFDQDMTEDAYSKAVAEDKIAKNLSEKFAEFDKEVSSYKEKNVEDETINDRIALKEKELNDIAIKQSRLNKGLPETDPQYKISPQTRLRKKELEKEIEDLKKDREIWKESRDESRKSYLESRQKHTELKNQENEYAKQTREKAFQLVEIAKYCLNEIEIAQSELNNAYNDYNEFNNRNSVEDFMKLSFQEKSLMRDARVEFENRIIKAEQKKEDIYSNYIDVLSTIVNSDEYKTTILGKSLKSIMAKIDPELKEEIKRPANKLETLPIMLDGKTVEVSSEYYAGMNAGYSRGKKLAEEDIENLISNKKEMEDVLSNMHDFNDREVPNYLSTSRKEVYDYYLDKAYSEILSVYINLKEEQKEEEIKETEELNNSNEEIEATETVEPTFTSNKYFKSAEQLIKDGAPREQSMSINSYISKWASDIDEGKDNAAFTDEERLNTESVIENVKNENNEVEDRYFNDHTWMNTQQAHNLGYLADKPAEKKELKEKTAIDNLIEKIKNLNTPKINKKSEYVEFNKPEEQEVKISGPSAEIPSIELSLNENKNTIVENDEFIDSSIDEVSSITSDDKGFINEEPIVEKNTVNSKIVKVIVGIKDASKDLAFKAKEKLMREFTKPEVYNEWLSKQDSKYIKIKG